MPGLLIKEMPEKLHQKLKEEARKHHRSMTRHALALLEEILIRSPTPPLKLPKPVRPAFLVKAHLIEKAIKAG